MKIESAIKKAYFDLKGKNIKTALLDSEILMSKVLKEERTSVLLNSERILSDQDYKFFKKLISNRLKYKPIAYLTGKKSFWKYEFELNDKVLIPRPDTELMVEQVLRIYKNKDKINFLEIGVGSGCIILSILKERKSFLGKGIDLSKDSIKICEWTIFFSASSKGSEFLLQLKVIIDLKSFSGLSFFRIYINSFGSSKT